MYRKQFLLTDKKLSHPNLEHKQTIENYFLYLGVDSKYEFIKTECSEFHLLGSVYDWENPEFTNKQILQKISENTAIDNIISNTDIYCGAFVLIVKLFDTIYIFNDASGQKEIYYDDNFRSFGTQPKLLSLSIEPEEHTDADAIAFYQSKTFYKKCLFVRNTTHKKNIFHLMPNHLLKVKDKIVFRFFPNQKIKELPNREIIKRSAEMLKGYISSLAFRNKLKMAVTGGYDSRVLFLSSLNVDCEYFISKHWNMNNSHHDIDIPKKITAHYNKSFTIEDDKICTTSSKKNTAYINDIDFPRFLKMTTKNKEKYIFVNGNISEISRNYYGYYKRATAKDLCFLEGYSNLTFAINQYFEWLKDKELFKKNGYHYLDMFYWEEKMGNWAAKSKTESHALGKDIVSPFNSRALLNLLLSSKRRYRDSHFNKLYDLLISELSEGDLKIIKMPINPCRKQTIIRFMKSLKIYNFYKYIVLNSKTISYQSKRKIFKKA
ncbi:hypothetical protein [Polaribacter sp. HL-MS24]|uniref:hypothetical protein n=1 Tax=Polaribacter sp. HL-MS24 TaxID=3077735 RepID=UPI002934C1BF|nr:hypothetical protein [Polaribacter sp. HL-MS24]WOC39927.1 hypothetical protein RRF69_09930 [Polaribacter sp. HL-MS24]